MEYYTSGEEDPVGRYHVKYSNLPEADKQKRVRHLWFLAYKKARGASVVVRKQYEQNNRIFTAGYKTIANVNYIQEQKQKLGNIEDVPEMDDVEHECLISTNNRAK